MSNSSISFNSSNVVMIKTTFILTGAEFSRQEMTALLLAASSGALDQLPLEQVPNVHGELRVNEVISGYGSTSTINPCLIIAI